MNRCKCGHKKEKHDFAIMEGDNIGKHCLGKDCNCKKYTPNKDKENSK
jgi:hypothetical protein